MLLSAIIIFCVVLVVFASVAVVDIVRARKTQIKYRTRDTLVALGMLTPAVILGFLFIMLPIVYSLGYAFTDYDFFDPSIVKFTGLKNFEMIFNEFGSKGDIYLSLINTLKFVILVVPLQIGMALGLALLVNRSKVGVGIFKVCYFAPVAISLAVTAYLWKIILSPADNGLFNTILGVLGIPPQKFLDDTNNAMYWIAMLSAWQGCGYQMLIFLSGLSNVRKELYEAASLDGAGAFTQFLNITVPGLRSTFVYVVITVFIGACRVMIQPYLMAGYYSHTMTLSYYMYVYGTTYGAVGYSSAVAILMTIIIGTITFIQRRFLSEKD